MQSRLIFIKNISINPNKILHVCFIPVRNFGRVVAEGPSPSTINFVPPPDEKVYFRYKKDFSDDNGFSIPDPPASAPKIELDEVLSSGQSILDDLGIWQPLRPSSYFRWALEALHYYIDIPWWSTIVLGTFVIRLAFISVPIMAQRRVAIMNKHHKEFSEFNNRISDARDEGDNLLMQQVLMEQNDFSKKVGINPFRQGFIMLLNGAVFATQFCAIKKMVDVDFPGFSTQGLLWFTDLTLCDPYYGLSTASAITLYLVVKSGIEYGNSPTSMSGVMKLILMYGIPGFMMIFGSQFPAAITLYWLTSNLITLFYAFLFRLKFIRRSLKIPEYKAVAKTSDDFSDLMSYFRKKKKSVPPSLYTLKQRDLEQFRIAGRSKPVTNMQDK